MILACVALASGEDRRGNPGFLEHVGEALGLRAGVGVAGDVQDQERRDALALGDVRDGGEVAVLRRVVAELLAVAELRLRQAVHPARVSAVSMMAGTS